MLRDSKSFNITYPDDGIISIFFKPASIAFKWYIENDKNSGMLCSKEINPDQFEMILYILKKEMQGL